MNPSVSVIIPVYNNTPGIRRCLQALLSQTWPPNRMEIIVVDNGSSDGTWERLHSITEEVRKISEKKDREGRVADERDQVADERDQVADERDQRVEQKIIIFQSDEGKTPYVARNRGVEKSKGKIIAFTDSTCIPEPDWIEKGVRQLLEEDADLLGGHVRFLYSDPRNPAERYDSLLNVEVKHNIADRGVAKTGNLFVRREVFDQVGLFDETVRSGGDVEWTGRATQQGHKIVYGADVIVNYEARRLLPLVKKFYRIGKGQPAIWRKRERLSRGRILWRILYDLRPVLPRFIHAQIRFRDQTNVETSMLSLMAVGWICRLANGAGRIRGVINSRTDKIE